MYGVCLKFHGFVIRWFLRFRLNYCIVITLSAGWASVIWVVITGPGHVFTLITPPPLIISVVQSAACVQVYSALYRAVLYCTAHRCLQLQSGHLHSHRDHQAPTRICRKRFHIAKGLQSYFAGLGAGGDHLYSSYLHCLVVSVGCKLVPYMNKTNNKWSIYQRYLIA